MNLQAVFHQPKSNYCYAYNENTVHLRIRTAVGEQPDINLIYGDKFRWDNHHETVMKHICSGGLFNYFTVEIPMMKRLAYYFKFTDGADVFYYTQWGIVREFAENQLHFYFFQYPYIHESGIHKTPEWVRDSIFYEIFPDRFFRENTGCGGKEDPNRVFEQDTGENAEQLAAWGTKPCYNSCFGGNLKGIAAKIGYLKDLGITAIYLTPIFKSMSNHKYDTEDYLVVDPHFGDLDDLKTLVSQCHENGIRVILDGVFNHCSNHAVPFQHALQYGPASPYYQWFHFNRQPEDHGLAGYEMFSTVRNMPKLNTEKKEVRDYLLSAVRYWMEETGIDGWRLDVADELDPAFLRAFRETVKQCREDAYIVGEVWHNASSWMMGDQLDAAMNYPFSLACINYFALQSIDTKEFMQMISKIQLDYTQQGNEMLFNLVESHDTARFLTLCGGDVNKLLPAVTFLLTFTGVPCLYYGMETGMEGGEDPDCRRTFNWDENTWDLTVYQYIRTLIHLRKEYAALRRGNFTWVDMECPLVAYERTLADQRILVLINTGEREVTVNFPDKGIRYTDLLSDQVECFENHDAGEATVSGFSARILLVKKNN